MGLTIICFDASYFPAGIKVDHLSVIHLSSLFHEKWRLLIVWQSALYRRNSSGIWIRALKLEGFEGDIWWHLIENLLSWPFKIYSFFGFISPQRKFAETKLWRSRETHRFVQHWIEVLTLLLKKCHQFLIDLFWISFCDLHVFSPLRLILSKEIF